LSMSAQLLVNVRDERRRDCWKVVEQAQSGNLEMLRKEP
jgi:hypothetical protein